MIEFEIVPEYRRQHLTECAVDACSCQACTTVPRDERQDLIRWCGGCFAVWYDITVEICPCCGKKDITCP